MQCLQQLRLDVLLDCSKSLSWISHVMYPNEFTCISLSSFLNDRDY
jgi:hypothetical protein